MSDSARKREKIVSLSQTEMMFVIAAVALVLFLLADTQRRTAQTSEHKISEELTALRATAARDDAPPEEDMLAEVAEILTAEGALAAGENSPQRLRREIPDAVRELARQKNESAAAQKEIDDALSATDAADIANAADTADAEDSDSRAQRIRRLLQDAARGEAAADALGIGDTPPATIAAEIKNLRRAIEGKDTRGNTRDHKLRFGFLPCWLGRGAQEPPYYFALDVVYRSGRYKIEPHPHLRAQAAVVQSALAGDLALLSSPPSGWIGEDEFERFGRRAQKQKNLQYPNNPECRLIAKINRGAGGHQIVFVRDRVGFYPIYE